MTFQVTARAPSARSEGAVLITPPKGPAVALSTDEARDLQRRVLSAVVDVEHGRRATTARRKASTQREIRRAAAIDEKMRERDD